MPADAITLTNRLANQLQRAELAERNGLHALARKFRVLAAETEHELTALGHPHAAATASLIGLSPGRVPPRS